jgi:hypothetical protein
MKTKMFISSLVLLLFANGLCLADRQLDRSEILRIFQMLTAEQHKTWMPAGTIVAMHEEYKAATKSTAQISISSEYRMTTNVTVRYNGEKFYWQIDVLSRTDSVNADSNAPNTDGTGQFDLNANRSRIFAWDGQKYSMYFRPANNVIVQDAEKLHIPAVVTGPLTAGFIPWGYGNFSYEKLSAAESWAIETTAGDQTQIQLTLNHPNGSQMTFEMDPDKNYAVLLHTVSKANSTTVNTYGNFLQIGDRWIPSAILLEQYKYSIAPENLTASDQWNFTSVNSSMPAEDSFEIDYETDALVEYYNSVTAKSVIYRFSKAASAPRGVDSDDLLIDKFDIDAAAVPQNCATAAIRYVASKLGKNVTGQQVERLAQNADKGTSLYGMKQFAQGIGLYCRAVRTDLQTLRSLADCQAILHLSAKNHYVILGNIDDKFVRTIDLTNRKFFDRSGIGEFGEDWSEGIALLISNHPINTQGTMIDIDDTIQQNIFGTGYSCTKVLQIRFEVNCSAPVAGDCGGTYEYYSDRMGCEVAPSGTCSMSILPKYFSIPCVVDPTRPNDCTWTGEATLYYMRACS